MADLGAWISIMLHPRERLWLPIIILLGGFTFWVSLVFGSSLFPYWRDSAQFVVTAYTLDIAHPAGYPLYSMLANLFTLLPVGSIALRVSYFSAFSSLLCFLLLVAICHALTEMILKKEIGQLKTTIALAALALYCLILSHPEMLIQSLTSEVYVLHSFLLLLIIFLLICGFKSSDQRFFLLAAFVVGLGAGNHITLAFHAVLAGLLLAYRIKKIRTTFLMVACSAIGFCVYAYLPLRSSSAVAFNTANPGTIDGLFNLLTNARAVLRPTFETAQLSWFAQWQNFLSTLGSSGAFLLVMGAVGLILLWRRAALVSCLLTSVVGLNLLLFWGWQAAPLVPSFFCLAIGCSWIVVEICRCRKGMQAAVWFSVVLLVAILNRGESERTFMTLRDNSAALFVARENMDALPPMAVYLTENQWFSSVYLQEVELRRRDVYFLYQPRALFPYYFEPFTVHCLNQNSVEFNADKNFTPQLGSLLNLLGSLSNCVPVAVESNKLASDAFLSVLRFADDGKIYLQFPSEGSVETGFSVKMVAHYKTRLAHILPLPNHLRADALHGLKATAAHDLYVLRKIGREDVYNEILSLIGPLIL